MAKHKFTALESLKFNFHRLFPDDDPTYAYSLFDSFLSQPNMSFLIGEKGDENYTNYVINAIPNQPGAYVLIMRPMIHSLTLMLNEENLLFMVHDGLVDPKHFAVVKSGFLTIKNNKGKENHNK